LLKILNFNSQPYKHNPYKILSPSFNMSEKEIKQKQTEKKEEPKVEEEPEILKTSNTRKLYIPFYAMAIILLITLAYIKINNLPLNPAAIRLAFGFLVFIIIVTEIHRLGNAYEINDTSIIHRKGYFTIETKRIQFGGISDSEVKQNIWQRLFLYGDIEVHMYSRESKALIKNINKPFRFVNFLQNKMKQSGGRRRG